MTSYVDPGEPPAVQHILDIEEGLDRLMGDQQLYVQMLRRFRQDYQHVTGLVRQALAQGDTERAQRHIHSLKGASGMIGAQELHHLAIAAEHGFHSAGLELQASLALVETALAGLLRVLDVYLQDTVNGPGAISQARAPATPETRALLARLAMLLDEGNGDAIDVLEQSATLLASCLGVAKFQEVASAAHQYDFEGALAALQPALAG
ncbi:phosphotransfer domain-containing protein [Duganella sp. FT92W]|uniref:Phosphotransfer domain-containing protein n=1 Tax=Pseudoduganella rivuli TaxID=2666085 RepID=A0A7X2LWS8_9BURK|nr:Hpt domain-containing protein [Pseudoduganella rivuli]MRV76323.1 phosphotransfer domain-containing protein [Pseudoduganella rivuli]